MHVSAPHREYHLINQMAQYAGLLSTNRITEQNTQEFLHGTSEAFAALATATSAYCGMLAMLTETNAKLASQLSLRHPNNLSLL
jgi:hypothetical protein